MTSARWLITGASGFLGRHLLDQLQHRSHPVDVLALVRDQRAWEELPWTRDLPGVEPLIGSVTEPAPWENDPRLEGLTGIVHLAALVRHSRSDAEALYRTNVGGTAAMVRLAAARRARMVFVSTSGTVGCFRTPSETADEDAEYCLETVSTWPYYDSKIRAEREARKLANEFGVNLVTVRPPVLLGPGDHRFRSTGHLIRFLSGRLPFIVRGGMHYADVRDAARALAILMELGSPRPIYHLTGTASTVEEFFAEAALVSGRPPPRRVVPGRLAWWLARALGPLHLLPDPVVIEMASHYWGLTSRYAETDLGYRSRPGRETIQHTVEWLRDHHPTLRPSDRPA